MITRTTDRMMIRDQVSKVQHFQKQDIGSSSSRVLYDSLTSSAFYLNLSALNPKDETLFKIGVGGSSLLAMLSSLSV